MASWEELNQRLLEACRERRARKLRGHQETIGERFARDRAAFLPLPTGEYEACEKRVARVSSMALVRYRSNDYSVPTEYGHRDVLVKGYVHEVVIVCGSRVIARHRRSYQREDMVFDPLHYLALLEQKARALDQAAPLVGWELPEGFARLRRLLEARLSKGGKREYVQVLRLLETFSLPGGRGGHPGCAAAGYDQLRRGQASAAVPHRAATTTAGPGELSASAIGRSTNHAGRRLHGFTFAGTTQLAE